MCAKLDIDGLLRYGAPVDVLELEPLVNQWARALVLSLRRCLLS